MNERNEEFFYVVEIDNSVLREIDSTLKHISSAVITSEPFEHGSEASIYIDHIVKTLPSQIDSIRTDLKNPDFFSSAVDIDYGEDWLEGEMLRVGITIDKTEIITARLIVQGEPPDMPTLHRTVH